MLSGSHPPSDEFVQQVLYTDSSGEVSPLENGKELLFAELRNGLRIACRHLLDDASIHHETCQVVLEVPFPLSDAMRVWGEEIIGYQPLILDAQICAEGDAIVWTPSQTSLKTIEGQLLYRMRDVIWEHVPEMASAHPLGGYDADYYINRLPLKVDPQYICLDLECDQASAYGLIFNWKGADNYWGLACVKDAPEEPIVAFAVQDGVYRRLTCGSSAHGDKTRMHFTVKQITDKVLYDACGVRGELPTKLLPDTRVGLVGGLHAERMVAVYPTFVENLLFRAHMVWQGHFQDRRTLARLIVKQSLVNPLGVDAEHGTRSQEPVRDYELYFYLVGKKNTQRQEEADPYGTDVQPSIGAHLLFTQEDEA